MLIHLRCPSCGRCHYREVADRCSLCEVLDRDKPKFPLALVIVFLVCIVLGMWITSLL